MIADRRGKIIEPAFVWSCFRFCVRDRNRVPRVSSPGGRGYRTLRRLQENEKVNFENFFFGFTNATEVVTSEDERCRLWAEILSMEKYLDRLVQLERFAEAAEVRDEIRELRNRDLWAILEAELNCAVREERYLDAARIRDELKLVPPPPGVKAESASMDELPPINPSPASECVSEGIRIAAQSFLLEEESSPPDNTFVFGYKVVIANESPRTVQLVRRHLRIRTESAVAELNGVGVIGKQPVLTPNEKFSYTCMCPLTASEGGKSGTVLGSMKGSYDFVTGKVGHQTFQARVHEFFHILP
mmetsp:Transcript_10957/g.45570  ORF Transcript_10957/g.45570 Transcript_10957/m.45570 type:complete len:301 (-) Transcript_10957:132-1034(-)